VPAAVESYAGPSVIVARTGPRLAGVADVVVTNPDGLSGILPGGFTYLAPPPPPEPFLPLDDFLAFGDSITEGVTSVLTPEGLFVNPAPVITGYPQRLQALLSARYAGQVFVVTNAGVGGEYAANGRNRLPTVMTPANDLVIILEGVNDLNAGLTPDDIVGSLRAMIQSVKGANKKAMLSTLTPVVASPSGFYKADPAKVQALNARLPALAASEGVPLVDMVVAFGATPGQYLSPDGLHPNEGGYQKMAQAFCDAIASRFQILK
jgi:lysophospholipase L1-like esterase